MRILFVLPRIVAGGLERVTLNLIAGLRGRGIDCLLAVGDGRGELFAEAERLGPVEVIAAGGKPRFFDGLWRTIRRYRPTHIVTAFADVSLMTLLARSLAGSRAAVIVGVHGTHGEVAAGSGWRARGKYRRDAWIAGWVYRHADAVVAVSQGVAEDVRRRYPDIAVQVIYSPILTAAMQRRIESLPAPAAPTAMHRLVAVGRLSHEKGLDVLVAAMPAVLAQFRAQLKIHGEGPERVRLAAQIERLHLQDRVRLMGSTDDPLEAIGAADLLVFPSRHEGFGVALVEALACGRQIVASDCTHGPAEILDGGRYGHLVTPGDPAALSRALLEALHGEGHVLPESLRARAAEFSAAAALDRYMHLLKGLASR